MQIVSKEVATEEIESWLDFKKVPSSEREEKESDILALIESMETGKVRMDSESKEMTIILSFPEDLDDTKELKFPPRKKTSDFSNYLKKVKAGDARGFILAHIACLTGVNTTLLSKMDTQDFKTCGNIVHFFL